MSGDEYFLGRLNDVRCYVAEYAKPFERYPRSEIVKYFRAQGWGNCGIQIQYLLTRLQHCGRLKHEGRFIVVDSDRVHWPVTEI